MDRKNHKLTRSRIKSLKKRLPVKSLINLRFMVRRLERTMRERHKQGR